MKRLTSLEGVFTLSGLSGQHDTVGTIEDGVGDIGDLGSGRSGVVLIVRKRCVQFKQGTYGHGLFVSSTHALFY